MDKAALEMIISDTEDLVKQQIRDVKNLRKIKDALFAEVRKLEEDSSDLYQKVEEIEYMLEMIGY